MPRDKRRAWVRAYCHSPLTQQTTPVGSLGGLVPKAIFLEQEHGVDDYCASPINSGDGTDNNLDEESQFPSGTLNANRGHLC